MKTKKWEQTFILIAVFFTFSAPSEGAVLSKTCKHIDPSDQVKLGECLFNNETFEGNGRTCATCHPPENNFTIDPKFIDTLPADDKLFVFEDLAQFPGLKMCRAPGDTPNVTSCEDDSDCTGTETCDSLENGVLLRKFGLILENVDGFNEPGRMRGVPHTLSMNVSIEGFGDNFGNVAGRKRHALGWSGDGSAGVVDSEDTPFTGFCDGETEVMCQGFTKAEADLMCISSCDTEAFGANGSIKAFALGATIQHFPKSLLRQMGVDFRLPTEEELEAMAAYQLAQGRQADIADLSTVEYKSAFVNEGRDQFFDINNRCNVCHFNAGANFLFSPPPRTNGNFDTGVESMLASPHFLEMVGAPVDGGFGSVVGPTTVPGGIGDGSFNSPPLIEAADTAPFMHNHSINTLEQAVAFYTSSNFGNSNAGGGTPVEISPAGVSAIAAFLRTINSLENIRLATGMLEETEEEGCSRKLVKLALADTEDAYQVLEGTEYKLYGNAVKLLKKAYQVGKSVKGHKAFFDHKGHHGREDKKCSRKDSKKIAKVISLLDEARNLIVVTPES